MSPLAPAGSLAPARFLALAVPSALVAGAWGSQLWGGLFPCEMCHWQRWPHYAAIGFGLLAFVVRDARAQRALVLLAALAVLVSGAIGAYHAGVEYKWWEGLTTCTRPPGTGDSGDLLKDIMSAPMIRCDEAQWTLWGISLAGYNALISVGSGCAVLSLMRTPKR